MCVGVSYSLGINSLYRWFTGPLLVDWLTAPFFCVCNSALAACCICVEIINGFAKGDGIFSPFVKSYLAWNIRVYVAKAADLFVD